MESQKAVTRSLKCVISSMPPIVGPCPWVKVKPGPSGNDAAAESQPA